MTENVPPPLVEYAKSQSRDCAVCGLPQREEIERAWNEAGVRATAIRRWLLQWEIDISVDRIRGHFERGHG